MLAIVSCGLPATELKITSSKVIQMEYSYYKTYNSKKIVFRGTKEANIKVIKVNSRLYFLKSNTGFDFNGYQQLLYLVV